MPSSAATNSCIWANTGMVGTAPASASASRAAPAWKVAKGGASGTAGSAEEGVGADGGGAAVDHHLDESAKHGQLVGSQPAIADEPGKRARHDAHDLGPF